jgi:transcriptional regulator with XRE-family HTH domain
MSYSSEALIFPADAFGNRLRECRKAKSLSQSELARILSTNHSVIGRYERGENKPTTEVLSKLANALSVSADYLMSGTIEENAIKSISDKELLEQFKKVEQLPNQKKLLVKEFLDAFIMKAELQSKFV